MAPQSSSAVHPDPSSPVPPTATAAVAIAGDRAEPPRYDFLTILPWLGFGVLTWSSIHSIRRSIHDPWTVAFICVTYVVLLLLYYCMYLTENTDASDVRRRERLKAAVWSLASILTVMLTYRVSAILPLAVDVFIWALSAVTVVGGFYVLFIYKEAPEKVVAPALEKNPDAHDKC